MALKVHNTLTRQRQEFVPAIEGRVGMYVCGPTVYDHPHIGHAKSYVGFDAMVRYLRYLGYQVRYVQNITDVGHLTDDADGGEDKIVKRAQQERVEPMELVETYMRSYFEDMDALGVVRPDISPRASGHIPEQIALVERLVEKGYAYEAGGSVYFDVSQFGGYGKLSGREVDEMEAGVRVEVHEDKRHPADFALWKAAPSGHIMRWQSPWGEGFPGWHVECSAMSMKYLGETLDIHGGGLENVFPHHECEIAQSEAATGQPFVRYWLHNNMVTVDGTKMGKSLGNFTTLKDAFKRHAPPVIRFFVLSTHYRSPLDFSESALTAAEKGLERLWNVVRNVRERCRAAESGSLSEEVARTLETQKQAFLEAMDEDFNTAGAIGALFELSKEVNVLLSSDTELSKESLSAIDNSYNELGRTILGIVPDELESSETASKLEEPLLQLLIETRNQLRAAKQYELADGVRNGLSDIGVTLEDKPEGTVWRKK